MTDRKFRTCRGGHLTVGRIERYRWGILQPCLLGQAISSPREGRGRTQGRLDFAECKLNPN